jgi:hypothetical protein
MTSGRSEDEGEGERRHACFYELMRVWVIPRLLMVYAAVTRAGGCAQGRAAPHRRRQRHATPGSPLPVQFEIVPQ